MAQGTAEQSNATADRAFADQSFADLLEQVTRELERRGEVNIAELSCTHPQHLERLGRLLPAMAAMASWARVPASGETIEWGTSRGEPIPGMLGDFRIIGQIGSGGMGTVYEAEQISMGRRVALKVLPFAVLVQERSLQRFRNEVRAAAMLDHPHIVSIYLVGEERGIHYYAMQLIRGQTLADVIRELRKESVASRPLSGAQEGDSIATHHAPRTIDTAPIACGSTLHAPSSSLAAFSREHCRSAARLGIQAAEALQHAHDLGVLHRDIKPGNLMLDREGKLYITDFGLARIEADAGMTVTGDILGTLRYMAPEQALAKRVVIDHRADVYSLGATLYELLTLQPAFGATDRSELLKQIAFEEPRPLRKLDRHIPAELETIVLKSIEKNPDARYQTAQQLADDLRAYLESLPIKAKRHTVVNRIAKWSRRHRPLVALSAVSIVTLAVTSLVILGIGNARIRREAVARTVALAERKVARLEANKYSHFATVILKANLFLVNGIRDRYGDSWLQELPQTDLLRDDLLKVANEQVEQFPDQSAPWYMRGSIYFSFREWERSIPAFSRAIEINPKDVNSWALRGQARLQLKMWDESLDDYRHVLKLDPNSNEAEICSGNCNFELGRYAQATMAYNRALKRDPKNASLRTRCSEAQYFNGEYETAIRDVTQAIEDYGDAPKLPEAYRVRAKAYFALGRYRDARTDWTRVIELAPNDPEAVNNLASLLATAPIKELRDGKRALELATKACEVSNYKEAVLLGTLGEAYAETGDFDAAIKWALRAQEVAADADLQVRELLPKQLEAYRNGKPWRQNSDRLPKPLPHNYREEKAM